MNQFRKWERTASGWCGSTPLLRQSTSDNLRNGLEIGAPAGAGQHLERPRLLRAIGQRGDGIVIQPVNPLALDIPDTDLAKTPADLPPYAAGPDRSEEH